MKAGHWRGLGWLLLALALLRIGSLVLAEPFVAYANQYDMTRSSACLGLWPHTDDGSLRESRLTEPQADYRYGGLRNEACYPSTVVVIAGIAQLLDAGIERLLGATTADFDLRQLGTLNLLLLAALSISVQLALRAQPRAALAHAALLLVLIADPINSLYASTLYTEFGALLGAYAACAGLLLIGLRGGVQKRSALLLSLGLVALGFSRVQHLLLPLALLACAALAHRGRSDWLRLAPALLLALLIPLLQLQLQSSAGAVDRANRTNTIPGAALPASADAARTAARLGLGARCVELVHVTWYQQRGIDPFVECPELAEVSRLRLLWVLATEPRTSLVLLARGLSLGSDWRMAYVGEQAGGQWLRVSDFDGPHPSLAALIATRGPVFLLLLWLLPLLLSLPALTRLLRGRALPLDALQVGAAGVVSIGLVTTFAGDGLIETARHLHLAANALLLLWAVLALRADWRSLLQRGRLLGSPMQQALLLGLLGWVAAWTLLPRLPLGFGAVDTPAAESFGPIDAQGEALKISGWALDANGLDSIRLVFSDGRSWQTEGSPDPFLSRMFPVAGAVQVRRFTLTVPADGAPGWIEFFAVSESGVLSRFERRRLLPAYPAPTRAAGSGVSD